MAETAATYAICCDLCRMNTSGRCAAHSFYVSPLEGTTWTVTINVSLTEPGDSNSTDNRKDN